MRLPTRENIMSRKFQPADHDDPRRTLNYRPQSALIFSHAHLLVKSALDGLGLAWVPFTMVTKELDNGQLVGMLSDRALTDDGYYMYYPGRLDSSPILRLLVDALRVRQE